MREGGGHAQRGHRYGIDRPKRFEAPLGKVLQSDSGGSCYSVGQVLAPVRAVSWILQKELYVIPQADSLDQHVGKRYEAFGKFSREFSLPIAVSDEGNVYPYSHACESRAAMGTTALTGSKNSQRRAEGVATVSSLVGTGCSAKVPGEE